MDGIALRHFLAIAISGLLSTASATAAGWGCQPVEPVRKILEEKYDPTWQMPWAEKREFRRRLLEELIASHPGESVPHRYYLDLIRSEFPAELPAVIDRYRSAAAANPDNTAAQYTLALALFREDTPHAIRILDRLRETDPGYAMTYRSLFWVHSSGRFEDKQKAASALAAYADRCPSSDDAYMVWNISRMGEPALQKRYAADLRKSLETETNRRRIREGYSALWGFEFRLTPPSGHPEVRERVAADIAKLEQLAGKPDDAWLALLINGLKQTGKHSDRVRAIEDRVLAEFPASDEAFFTMRERWYLENPSPAAEASTEVWDQYLKRKLDVFKEWARKHPNRQTPIRFFYEIADLRFVSNEEFSSVTRDFLAASERQYGPSRHYWLDAARAALKRDLDSKQALAWLRKAKSLPDSSVQFSEDGDMRTGETQKRIIQHEQRQALSFHSELLLAHQKAGDDAIEPELRRQTEAPLPEIEEHRSIYWWNRARLASIDQRKPDALAYYQLALRARKEPPAKRFGRINDPLTEEARSLWKAAGGTETAWDLWITPPRAAVALTGGRWETPKRELPPFDLSDLSGKTWSLKSLEGKTLLINVWATWCGPCRTELPKLEQLYRATRTRTDLQILTFNIDEELGQVEPFLKEYRYSFPVLPAYVYVNGLLTSVGIPQNWIVDSKGKWRWQQIGFDDGAGNWEGEMLKRLEATRPE